MLSSSSSSSSWGWFWQLPTQCGCVAAVPPAELGRGRIRILAAREGDEVVIEVVDNGVGLPQEGRNRLPEPYGPTREQGTGLGL